MLFCFAVFSVCHANLLLYLLVRGFPRSITLVPLIAFLSFVAFFFGALLARTLFFISNNTTYVETLDGSKAPL